MRRLLRDNLPLRRSLVMPDYRVDAVLPWVYGRVTLSPIPLDADGLEYLVADHPIVGVTAVRVAAVETSGWALSQRLDGTGHEVSVLRLAQAPADGATVAADVIGRRHPVTGAALEHPADIAADLLRACGWTVDDAAFDAMRDAHPAMMLGGLLTESQPLRTAVSAVIACAGAGWAADPLCCWIPGEGDPVATLTPALLDSASAEASSEDLVTRLVVTFDYDWSAGTAAQSLTLEAPDAIERHGELESSLDLPWIRTARDALAVATAWLEARARPTWTITLTARPGTDLAPRDVLTLAHPWIPAGPAQITRITAGEASRAITLTRPAGDVPRVALVGRGARIGDSGVEPLKVEYKDGVATFTILTELGEPLAGATVTLDEMETRISDRFGRVQFRTTRGAHSLLIVASGYEPMDLGVTV